MPTKEYRRAWCVKCEEWKLFEQHYPNWDDWFCRDCETQHAAVKLSAIPEEKLVEQRERYKQSNRTYMEKMMSEMMNPNLHMLQEMFSEPGSNVHIVEADAGQKYIDDKRREKEAEERMKRHEKRMQDKAEVDRYKDVGRNDMCACGSGKKYKKCCLTKIQEKWVKL